MKHLLKATSLFAVALVCSVSLYAQAPIKKPEKKQQSTTTTTPKPRTSTNTNRRSQTKTDTNTNTQTSTSKDTAMVTTTTDTPKPVTPKQTDTSTQSRGELTEITSPIEKTRPSTKPTTGSINGHEWVDLGLSVKWATCNVGASSPSDYGNYYTWGDTRAKSSYTEKNSVTYGKSMGSISGNSKYDAACANWGGTWRLPTVSEIDELVKKCKCKWAIQGGHRGYKVTGPNGNSIFLPAAGWRYETPLRDAGEDGGYWSATPYEDDTSRAYGLYFDWSSFDRRWSYRYYGRSVRPVSD